MATIPASVAAGLSRLDMLSLARPELRVPTFRNGKDLPGPFWLDVVTATGGATAQDLTLQARWFADQNVRTVYAVGNVATKFRAVLQLEAVELLWIDPVLQEADTAVKAAVSALGVHVSWQVGQTFGAINLIEGMREASPAVESTDTTKSVGPFRGEPQVLPEPIRINLENGQLVFRTDGTAAAAYVGRLKIYGALTEIEGQADLAPGYCPSPANMLMQPADIRRMLNQYAPLRGRYGRG